MMQTGRPPTWPTPVTTPSAGVSASWLRAKSQSSWNSEPASSRSFSRSRTNSLPSSRSFSRYFVCPCSMRARSAKYRPSLMPLSLLGWIPRSSPALPAQLLSERSPRAHPHRRSSAGLAGAILPCPGGGIGGGRRGPLRAFQLGDQRGDVTELPAGHVAVHVEDVHGPLERRDLGGLAQLTHLSLQLRELDERLLPGHVSLPSPADASCQRCSAGR